jgi:hypothetical protein
LQGEFYLKIEICPKIHLLNIKKSSSAVVYLEYNNTPIIYFSLKNCKKYFGKIAENVEFVLSKAKILTKKALYRNIFPC